MGIAHILYVILMEMEYCIDAKSTAQTVLEKVNEGLRLNIVNGYVLRGYLE